MLIGNDAQVLIAEFGVTDTLRAIAGDEGQPAQLAGTLCYLAPERLRGGPGDALGSVLVLCRDLASPPRLSSYAGGTARELLEAIEGGVIGSGDPHSWVPHWLSRVVRKGLKFDPDRHHRNMHALVRALNDEPPRRCGRSED